MGYWRMMVLVYEIILNLNWFSLFPLYRFLSFYRIIIVFVLYAKKKETENKKSLIHYYQLA